VKLVRYRPFRNERSSSSAPCVEPIRQLITPANMNAKRWAPMVGYYTKKLDD
jgi:hypothetical protein